MGFFFVLAALALVALSAHVALVVLTFRISTRWGLMAVLVPPIAWVVAFGGHVRERIWAAVALGCLLLSVGWVADALHQLGQAIAISGVSVGEGPH